VGPIRLATPELLVAVAKAGFNLVRISRHLGAALGPATELCHRSDWLARVEEVVGYARSAGLYSIIQFAPRSAVGCRSKTPMAIPPRKTMPGAGAVRSVWTQIAKYFANQGERADV